MNEQEREFIQRLEAIEATIGGLHVEIEAWRRHTSTTADFLQDAIRSLVDEVKTLPKALKP